MAEPRFSVARVLTSPRLVVGEIVALAFSGVLMTLIPQQGGVSSSSAARGTTVPAFISTLGLDRVARTWWFLGLVLLGAASLVAVLAGQVRRVRAEWSRVPGPESFRGAPLRVEFVRRTAPAGGSPATTFRVRGRLGLLGAPLFHLGLVVVAVAGIVRMTFGADAQVDLFEGELLPAAPTAWAAQWPGLVARPFSLEEPVRLEAVRPSSYASGALLDLHATIAVGSAAPFRRESVSVNTPLALPGGRLFVTSLHGPTVFLELGAEGADAMRRAVLLQAEQGRWQGRVRLPNETEAWLSARETGALPSEVEIRLLRDGRLAWLGVLRPGQRAAALSGTTLSLVAVRWWLRIGGTRDASLGIAYSGFALLALGAFLTFAVIPVAEAVLVETTSDGERVIVALRPRRFAPLYAERLEAIARREGARTP